MSYLSYFIAVAELFSEDKVNYCEADGLRKKSSHGSSSKINPPLKEVDGSLNCLGW